MQSDKADCTLFMIHKIKTNQGIFVLPNQWKEYLGPSVLEEKVSIKSRLSSLGIKHNYDRHLAYLKEIEAFRDWYSHEVQVRLGIKKGFLSKEAQLKKCATNRLRYGGNSCQNSEEIRQKRFSTMRLKYGGNAPACSDKVIQKMKSTNLSRYGTEFVLSSPQIRSRIEKTCLKNYNTKNPLNVHEIKEKAIKTNIRKYGTSNPAKLKIFRDKAANTIASTRGLTVRSLSNGWKISSLRPLEEIATVRNTSFKAECLICGKQFISHYNKSSIIPTGCPFCNKASTAFERALALKLSEKYEVLPHFRLKNRQEIDIYLPQLKLGIEVNGIFTHNSTANLAEKVRGKEGKSKSRSYHRDKQLQALKEGITLIHIWEHKPLKKKGLEILAKYLRGTQLEFNLPVLATTFKLRTDFYPEPPYFPGYSATWHEETWITDSNGNQLELGSPKALVTYTSGIWLYTKTR